jgi:putative transposase
MNLTPLLGEREACRMVGYPRASFQRHYVRTDDAIDEAVAIEAIGIESGVPEPIPSRQQRRYQARVHQRDSARERHARYPSPLALNPSERQAVLDAVHQERFIDRSVPYIHATLLDEGTYHCSISTMYRILHDVGEVGERRDQATRPAHVKPELCATAPRQVFAWDITKLHGPQKWTYFCAPQKHNEGTFNMN